MRLQVCMSHKASEGIPSSIIRLQNKHFNPTLSSFRFIFRPIFTSEVLSSTSPVFRTTGINNFPCFHEAFVKCWIVSRGTPPAGCNICFIKGTSFPCFHKRLACTIVQDCCLTTLIKTYLACRLVSRGTPPVAGRKLAERPYWSITYEGKYNITIYPRSYHGPYGSGDSHWLNRMVPCDALCAMLRSMLRCVCICAAFHAVHWRFDERNCSAETSLTYLIINICSLQCCVWKESTLFLFFNTTAN